MTRAAPDFYLTSAGEGYLLGEPRWCWSKARLRGPDRDDYMLVDIEPALMGQSFGLGGKDITTLLLATRHQGSTLYPITEWPCYVHVARLLDETTQSSTIFAPDKVETIAWGCLYPTLADAEKDAGQFR